MRCKSCNYPLWTIRGRLCPECGEPFKPSDFEFLPGSVRYCCPHCDQAYYGTAPNGHLDPTEFICSRCNLRITQDEMVVMTRGGVPEWVATQSRLLPWLDTQNLRFFRRWINTVGLALIQPRRMAERTPVEAPLGRAVVFLLVHTALVAPAAALPFSVFYLLIAFAAGGMRGLFGPIAVFAAVLFVGSLVVGPLAKVIGVFIWGGVAHGLLRMTGRTLAGAGRTVQSLCYASGASVVTATPCMGPFIGWIWTLISSVGAVAAGQRVSVLRASFATLTLPVLGVLSVVTLQILFVYMGLSAARFAASSRPPFAGVGAVAAYAGSADTVQMAVNIYRVQHGRFPTHSADLIATGALQASDFAAIGSGSALKSVPLGAGTLDSVAGWSQSQIEAAADAEAAALPADVVAHRLGDYVFTYHGVDPLNAPEGVWVVILSPDPDQPAPTSLPWCIAVEANGMRTEFAPEQGAEALAKQNVIRAVAGLPPLPDPATVTHGNPARATP